MPEIFKVQLSVSSSKPSQQVFIYNRDRSDNMYFSYVEDEDVATYGSRVKAMVGVWKAATR